MPTFESYVINSILVNNEFGITSINNLESVKSMGLDRSQYPQIANLIKSQEFEQLKTLPFGKGDFEFLEIMSFSDQKQNNYIVTVYSNNSLENDPKVIDIFPAS